LADETSSCPHPCGEVMRDFSNWQVQSTKNCSEGRGTQTVVVKSISNYLMLSCPMLNMIIIKEYWLLLCQAPP
jgi:hypothetical protein